VDHGVWWTMFRTRLSTITSGLPLTRPAIGARASRGLPHHVSGLQGFLVDTESPAGQTIACVTGKITGDLQAERCFSCASTQPFGRSD
jgi:hypothetical protein